MSRILTDAEVIAQFGDPTPYLNEDGTISPQWETTILGWATLPQPLPLSWNRSVKVRRFRCHYRIVPSLQAALTAIAKLPDAWDSINDFGGCYAWRPMRRSKSNKLSRHGWGIALDIDVADNPFGRTPQVNKTVLEIFQEHGYFWGGNFPLSRRDGMHFEPSDDWLRNNP